MDSSASLAAKQSLALLCGMGGLLSVKWLLILIGVGMLFFLEQKASLKALPVLCQCHCRYNRFELRFSPFLLTSLIYMPLAAKIQIAEGGIF